MSGLSRTADAAILESAAAAVVLIVQGRVQGVGFRPAVVRLAMELDLRGQVRNTTEGVEITLEGSPLTIEKFERDLAFRLPERAHVHRIERHQTPVRGEIGFRVGPGFAEARTSVAIPADMCACRLCLADVADSANRRFGYPLASCTDCGPRYSILQSLPYEREATTMASFSLCSACRQEYCEPEDRRFHAQTTACRECGPRCWSMDSRGMRLGSDEGAIAGAVQALRAGEIVALKGLGGYQLLVDATNCSAVARLRSRKQRPDKPLALLVDSLASANSVAELTAAEEVAIAEPSGPIVVVPVRRSQGLAPGIAPGLRGVGLMLPTTPLHWLLARDGPPLVATSGNIEGEPLEYEEHPAQQRLAGIADCLLHHDRPILQPVDDCVVRVIANRPVTLRLGRGVAPLPLDLGPLATAVANRMVLAVGGHLKAAIALFNGTQAALGPHVGDLDDFDTRERLNLHIAALCRLLAAKPAFIAHDMHPDYYTSQWAAGQGQPMLAVQHHHAHVVAGMIEHGWLDRDVLGVAWDGTGYGLDGSVWGGEMLRATTLAFRRVSHLRPFRLAGGKAAVRQPWRVALALLSEAVGRDEALRLLLRRGYCERDLTPVLAVLDRPRLSPLATSAGRLIEGLAALLLPLEFTAGGRSSFEGQLAMYLEEAAGQADGAPGAEENSNFNGRQYPFPLTPGNPAELDWRPLVAAVVTDLRSGVDSSMIAWRLHAALARGITSVADEHCGLPVVLGGGVFQNRLLVEELARLFADRRQPLGLPGKIPPNDGGLAAGQLVIALAHLAASDS